MSSSGGEADAAAFDEAAAAAVDEVEGVGRSEVHEWLDHHSWASFVYEVPLQLRDAAELAHGQAGGSLGVAVSAEGPDRSSRYSAQAAAASTVLPAVHGDYQDNSDGDAGSDSEQVQLSARLRRFGLGAEGEGPDGGPDSSCSQPGNLAQYHEGVDQAAAAGAVEPATGVLQAGTVGSNSQLLECGLLGSSNQRPGSSRNDTAAHSAGDAYGSRPGSALGSSRSDCSAAGGAAAAGMHMTACSRSGELLLPADAAATAAEVGPPSSSSSSRGVSPLCSGNQTASAGADAFNVTGSGLPSTDEAANAQQPALEQQQEQPGLGRSGSSRPCPSRPGSSSTVRLLSPGSHRYTAGSPVAQDSCCSSCSLILSPRAAAGTPPAQGGSSGSGATLLHVRDWGLPAAQSGNVQLPQAPGRSTPQHQQPPQSQQLQLLSNRVPTVQQQLQQLQAERQCQAVVLQQQQQQQAGSSTAVVLGSCQGHVSLSISSSGPVDPGAAFACAEQPGSQDRVAATLVPRSSDLIQPGAVPANAQGAPATQAGGETASNSASSGVGREYINSGVAACSLGAAAQLEGQHFNQLPVLLHNRPYMSGLVASLPGVDPASPAVQGAVRELQDQAQAELLLQCQQQHEQHMAGVCFSAAPGDDQDVDAGHA